VPADAPAASQADVGRTRAEVVAQVLAARRYRWLAPEFVDRVAEGALRRTRRPADAVKETKRRLHQTFGAYVDTLDAERVVTALRAAAPRGDGAMRDAARAQMAGHSSTRERLPILERFYAEIFAVTGAPQSVVDLASGLGTLALPWMGLAPAARYAAFDVDRRFVEIAQASIELFRARGSATLCDVVANPPREVADVALLLKAVPCLEQQATGSAARLLDAINARWLVVSFPTRSLGGGAKGMVSHYREVMAKLADGRPWNIRELLFPVELVFAVGTGR
jgi:16S rRNA (guanine(1405)-N(7))-methyltransferase